MARRAVVWQVLPGKLEEYEAAHAAMPDALAEEIRRLGTRNFSVYHHPGTDQLFAYYEQGELPQGTATVAPAQQRWWEERMSVLLASNTDGTPVQHHLTEVFHLD